MANWITHTLVADEILRQMPQLDRTGFVGGSLAPDCNVENADWTAFTPPREVTHFMAGDKKTSADLDGFRARYISGRMFASEEERSFFLGYWAHLALDVMHMRFIRDEQRVAASFGRIKAVPEMHKAIAGQPETLDTLKTVFGKDNVFADIVRIERRLLSQKNDSSYRSILPSVSSFPEYFDLLPKGAIVRKIPILMQRQDALPDAGDSVFFTAEEYDAYFRAAIQFVLNQIG